ncbi:MAG: hypothetical protein J6Z04_02780 [Clostridia bacterium]|nr:hypothetical protein [Clostridia bacterium]
MKPFRLTRLIVFVLGAVLLLVFNEFFLHNLRWFIGGLIVLYGSLGILALMLAKVKPIYEGQGFLFFSVEILLGLTTLCFIKEYATVCVIWAVWSILRESVELEEIVERELHPSLAVFSGIESVAVIVLSIMLMIEPGEHHAMIHSYLLAVELVLAALIPVINHRLMPEKKGRDELL